MNFFKKIMPLVVGLMIMSAPAMAQVQQQQQKSVKSGDISEQELQNFLTAASQVRTIQRNAQMKLQKMINNEGLKPQRFRTIMMSKQNPKMADSVDVTEKEEKAYQNIKPKLAQVNKETMQKFQGAFSDNEISRQRFQQIAMAARSDKDLQQRIQKMRAKKMQSSPGDSSDNS